MYTLRITTKKWAIILSVTFILLSNVSFLKAQQKFNLKGNIIGIDSGKIELRYRTNDGAMQVDTSFIINGQFLFSGVITEPTQCGLYTLDRNNSAFIFMEPTNQVISLREKDFYNFTMQGSFTQRQADTLAAQKRKLSNASLLLRELYDSLNEKYIIQKDSVAKAKILATMDCIISLLSLNADKLDSIDIEFIKQHPNSYVSAALLSSMFVTYKRINHDRAEELYRSLTQKLQHSINGNRVFKQLEAERKSKPGFEAFDIHTKDINDSSFILSALSNKYVLIDFWASWCIPCREAIPRLKEIYRLYNKKGLEIVMISVDESDKSWKNAAKKEQLDSFYNIIINPQIEANYINSQMPIPSQILIDRNGKILWNSIFAEDAQSLDSIINEVLK